MGCEVMGLRLSVLTPVLSRKTALGMWTSDSGWCGRTLCKASVCGHRFLRQDGPFYNY